jgi:ABC-type glycerol-3-phosphate transport system permease component
MTRKEGVLKLMTAGLLAGLALCFLLPIVYAVFTSLKTEGEILSRHLSLLPRRPSLVNYHYVFLRGAKYLAYYKNSIVITLSGVVLTAVLSAMSGYAFAKLPFKGRDIVMLFILFVIAFPLAAVIIPIYIMEFNLNLLNTNLGLILPNVMTVLPFSTFIMRGIFRSIPDELEEAAEIDGCGVFRTWLRIMLPNAKNGLAIVAIFSFYNIWGEYLLGKTLATEDAAMPIAVALTLVKGESWNFGVLGAVIVLAILPPVAIFIIFQKQLVKGLMQGAVKG